MMHWFHRIRAWRFGELVESVIRSRSNPRRTQAKRQRRPVLEQLEIRLAPAVTFDAATGLLTVSGDEYGATNDVITVRRGSAQPCPPEVDCIRDPLFWYVEVRINDMMVSSDPSLPSFVESMRFAWDTRINAMLINGGDGDDMLSLVNEFDEGAGFALADGHATMLGGSGNDSLTGGVGADRLDGQAGDDLLIGAKGNDTLIGGLGNDSLRGEEDSDTVDFAAASAGVRVNLQRGFAKGQGKDNIEHVENIVGTQFRDVLSGNTMANNIQALGGNDILRGGQGNDLLDGGAGNDQLLGEDGDDTLEGGGGKDKLQGGIGANVTRRTG